LALGEAIEVHKRLYGSMANISRHTTNLVCIMHNGMTTLRHPNGQPVCHIYSEDEAFGEPMRQGGTVAFNVFRQDGTYVPYSTVESMANEKRIYVRSGGKLATDACFAHLLLKPFAVYYS
jgi:hypothetical protein